MLNTLVGVDICIVNIWEECCSSRRDVVQMRWLEGQERTCKGKGKGLAKRVRLQQEGKTYKRNPHFLIRKVCYEGNAEVHQKKSFIPPLQQDGGHGMIYWHA
jgi:hypothetical protein